MSKSKGSFTLPGEAGYEELTLKMAEKWGADVIRDSDGTVLSEEITKAGYGIYSTICIIRDHNKWAKKHKNRLQQSFLMTQPVLATESVLSIHLMEDFFEEQFIVNADKNSVKIWQVFDRTENVEVPKADWIFDKECGNVVIQKTKPFHRYTVNFLAYQIWEQISMYNHVTNSWDKEHLMPIDPRNQETQEYMLRWMEDWCKSHPDTTVVRFTSMFYNFVWMWGKSEKNRYLFSDWGSYDFTVSPETLDCFEQEYGYRLTSEDFINQGKFHVTHMPPTKKQRDYMEFINRFVVSFGKKLVDIVHQYGKQAYVFYDDSWIGVEPYSDHFTEFGFDGLIKCVFSGYEARLCAGAKVETHELRLHPYLFPVGLGGAPTFMEGGNPALAAKQYWISVRRALLRQPVDRLGLGGYLHLTEGFPDFVDYIEELMDEFRQIKDMHKNGGVYTLPLKVAVLHSWGSLRSWTLSGHFHETYMHHLIHINEALSGLPIEVCFLSFEDVKNGLLDDVNLVINAGRAMDAWSGGDAWRDSQVVETIRKWVFEGGVFMGVNEPSAVDGYDTFFRLADVLGVDLDTGAKVCHGKWPVEVDSAEAKKVLIDGFTIGGKECLYLVDGKAKVLFGENEMPLVTVNEYGKGKGVYLAGFEKNNINTRTLLNLMLYATGMDLDQRYLTDCADAECAYYEKDGRLVVINNSEAEISTSVLTAKGRKSLVLQPFETRIVEE